MASSIRVTDQVNWYRHEVSVRIVSQDVVANTSRVYFEYKVTNQSSYANGAWTALNNTPFTVTINGVTHNASPNFDFRVQKTYVMVSGYQTIAHGSDGTKTVTVSFTGAQVPGSSYFTPASGSGSWVMSSIPRASKMTVTPNPVYVGGTVTINLERAVSTFTHDITWESGSESGTIDTGVGTSTTWTPDPDLLGSGTRVGITIYAQTKSGSTNIGTPVQVDLILRTVPEYPEIGQGTPYDMRFKRVELVGGKLTPKEVIPFLSATTTDTNSSSATCTITVSSAVYATPLDEAVVLAEFYDGAQWLSDDSILYVLNRVENDKTDLAGTVTYTGVSYVDYLLSKNLVAVDLDWPVRPPGDILWQYVIIGQERGWGPHIDMTFTKTKTSINTAWKNTTDLNVSKDTPVSQLLDGFVSDILMEYRTHFDAASGKAVIDAYNPGYGADWTVPGADPMVSLGTAAMFKVADKAPVRKDFSNKLTRVNVRGDEISRTRERADQVNPIFGHLEGSVTATGVKTADQLINLGEAALTNEASAVVERTFTYDLSSTQTSPALYPYRTFRPGDWILVPGDNGPEKARVAQVAITRDDEGTRATVTVGDMIPNGIAATARKLTQATSGAIAGGTMGLPAPLSSAIPAAPTILDVTPTGYWDEAGMPKSGIYVSWTPVTSSLSGSDIDVDLYEVWTRGDVGEPWSIAVLSDTTEATIAPLEVNQSFDIRIRARSQAGIFGEYSDIETTITPVPNVDLDAPEIADLYTDGVGNIFVVWGGLVGGDPAPLRLAYVGAEVSSDDGATYVPMGTPITAAGAIVVNPNTWGDFKVRLRGYDRLGNPGDASDPQDISTSDPHLDPTAPKAPENLAVTAGASWDDTGYLPEAWFDITWDEVTEDVDDDPIEIVGYDLYGRRDVESVERFLTSVGTNEVRFPVGNMESWTFVVRAVSSFGGVSAPSDPASGVADAEIGDVPTPATPTLAQYAGILQVKWDGGGMIPAVRYAYAAIGSSPSGPFTRAGMPLNGPGEVVIPGLAPGDYYARIVMVDELGQSAASAVAGPITLLPITGVTYQTSPLPNTGIKITSSSLTAYDGTGVPTFVLDATTGEVWIAPYDAVFEFGADGSSAETGDPAVGLAISSENSSFNTFFFPGGVQIRNDQTPLSWWEADPEDSSLVNFHSPRAVVSQRLRIADYEARRESKSVGSRLVFRYRGEE